MDGFRRPDRYIRPEDLSRPDSEAGILATLVHHPEYYFSAEYLLPEHFSDPQNRALYQAIIGMVKDLTAADTSVIPKIDTYGILEYVKQHDVDNAGSLTKENIDQLIEMSGFIARGSAKEYKILVSNVWDASFRSEMIMRLKECVNVLRDPTEEDAKKKVYNLVDSVMTSYSYGDDLEMFTERIDGLWQEIQSRQGTGYSGIPFKFPALNDYVTIERGELVIFGAQQKVGKSIMLLNCAVDLLKKGYSVLYIDSELSDRLFAARILAHLSGITYRDLTSGHYSEEEKEKILEARDWIKSTSFNHIYMPFFDADNIYMTVKQMNHIKPIDVLIVDYFKSTGNEIGAYETYASMGRCVDVIKNEIAGAMNIAAIGAAQATMTNRLADSAKIARNASTVIMMVDKTPEEIKEDGEECGDKKLIVTVNRNGMQHAQGEYISLKFDGNHILFEQAQKQAIPKTPY